MQNELTSTDYKSIPGWGADLEISKRPAYPMWSSPPDGTGAHWDVPPKQELKFKEFHSIERPEMTSVFGTSVAPKGLSGLIRAFAFRYSEGSWPHWIPLLFADRVNMIEGIFEDLFHGHVPNLFAEMGGKAELKHNPKGFAKKVAVAGVVLLAVPLIFKMFKKDASHQMT